MRMVIQRSGPSNVTVDSKTVGEIEHGIVCLLCLEKGDDAKKVAQAAQKLLQLRIFENPENQKMDLNIQQVQGKVLCISQFTLSWDGKKGNRPSFDNSMPPNEAEKYYRQFCEILREKVSVETGEFGAKMQVNIQNLGPVTFSLDY